MNTIAMSQSATKACAGTLPGEPPDGHPGSRPGLTLQAGRSATRDTAIGGIATSAVLYAAWVLATYVLEGRRHTLLRPEAMADRLAYALAANLIIGTVLAAWVVRVLMRRGAVTAHQAGFRPPRPVAVSLSLAGVIGLALILVLRPPEADGVVIANVFAQALPVSVAEVMVCWAIAGAVTEHARHRRGVVNPRIRAWLVAAALFGLYHFAHSPPYDTWLMAGLLAGIGLLTGAFFILTRDVYGTVVLHNALATIGVTQSLAAAGRLGAFQLPNLPLYATAAVAVATLVLLDVLWVRRAFPGQACRPVSSPTRSQE